jgi:hypothetical protein
MSGTRRTPIGREPTKGQISERAIDLYISMARLKCTCPKLKPPTQGPCAGCERWHDLHNELHIELQCRPWQWPCVGRQGPKAAGSPAYNEDIAARMALLDEAVRRRSEKVPAALSPPP